MAAPTIAVLHGDQTGEELLREALRLLEPGVLGIQVETKDFDVSLEARRSSRNQCVLDAAQALRELGFGIKAATVTPESSGDVGSPNAILRKQIDGRVIVRTGRRIPGVRPLAGVHAPISVIRMAVDDAYGAKEWTNGPTAPRRSAGGPAESSPSTRSRTRGASRPKSSAAQSTPSARSTKACSKRSSTRPPS